MLEVCEVLGCGSTRQFCWHQPYGDPEPEVISFFDFPSDEPFRSGWFRFTGRTALQNPRRPLMCSVHFRKCCFLVQRANEGRQAILLHGSMPSLRPPLQKVEWPAPAVVLPSMFLPARGKFEDPRKVLEMVLSFSRPAVPPLAFVPTKEPLGNPRQTIEDIENVAF